MRPGWRLVLVLLACAFVRAQEPEDPVAFAVAGRVVDRDKEPLAGVRVEAWDRMAPERYLAQTVSGAKGRFVLAVRASAAARREHPYAPVILVVRGAGMAEARVEAPAGARDLEIRTEAAVVVRGVVRYLKRAVPAAVVRAWSDLPEWRQGPPGGIEETTTDEEGRFVLRRFANQDLIVDVNADGIRTRRRVSAGRAVEIEMPYFAQASGRLLDADTGAVIAGARLLREGRLVGTTDAQGRFSFPETRSVSEFRVSVAFWKEGYDAGPATVIVGETARETYDYRLTRVAPLRGRVVDERGNPVSAARVVLKGTGIVAWSDEIGAFNLPILPRGIGLLRAAKPGYVDAAVRMEIGYAPDTVTLQLLRGARVSGRVLRDGEPALGVSVAVYDGEQQIARAFTDPKGRFLLRGVPVRGRTIVAHEARRRSLHLALEGLAEGALVGPLAIEVKEHLPWSGVVRSDAGNPLPNARVRCGEHETKTDEQGRFRFESLPVQTYEVRAEAPRHLAAEELGFPGRPLELVLESRFGDRRIAVRVKGESSGEARVALRRRWPPRVRRSGVTRLPGRVNFEGLMPGDYDLTVNADSHLEDTRVVVVAGKDIEVPVTLARGGSVELAAAPGAAVAIQAVRGKAPPVVALKLADGKRELRGFGPGRYRFISRAPGELIVVKEVDLGPSTPPVRLDLRGGKESTLTVTVLDVADAPMEDAEITLATADGFAHNTRRKTGADGRVVLTRLLGGPLHVVAQRGNRVGRAPVEITPGAELSVTVVVR
ncbi:MAG: carboxypeptidase regulatory-like domain-containing protein [Planctomycetota bacterium]|jgi:protocatechuate 3,4-dioxygenase beta subunit